MESLQNKSDHLLKMFSMPTVQGENRKLVMSWLQEYQINIDERLTRGGPGCLAGIVYDQKSLLRHCKEFPIHVNHLKNNQIITDGNISPNLLAPIVD